MQEKSLIKKNILNYIDYKRITKYKFYQKTGITRGVLNQNNGMSEENINRFLAYYAEVNPEWLITGKGKMIKDEFASDEISEYHHFSEKKVIEELKETIKIQKETIKTQRELIEFLKKQIQKDEIK